MSDSMFNRVRRIISSKADDTLNWLEASNPAAILRAALREMDKSIEMLEQARVDETGKRVAAERAEKERREQAGEMGIKARFALEQGRDDLARGALAEQIRLEADQANQKARQRAATDRIAQLEDNIAQVRVERIEMKTRLDQVEANRAKAAAENPSSVGGKIGEAVSSARETFDRVTGASTAPYTPADSEAARQVDEVSALQMEAEINARLAAMSKGGAAKSSKAAAKA